jgi:TonB-linked SusC/RagA family outer membrane protein
MPFLANVFQKRRQKLTWLLPMKLTIALLLVSVLSVNAKTFSQITIKEKNIPLVKAISLIQKQSGYDFLYNYEIIQKQNNISLTLQNVSIEEALNACFKNRPLSYAIVDRTVIIKSSSTLSVTAPDAIPESYVAVPLGVIKGHISDENGKPLSGATIAIKGTTTGTSTDADGNFSLTVKDPQNVILIISFVGYKTQEVSLQNKTSIAVVMQVSPELQQQDVVVVGYSTQKKASLTAAVTTIKPEDVRMNSSPSISNALAGVSPGLVINNRSGKPGYDDALMLIRGYNTFAAGSTGVGPLIVVDGIPDRNMNRINPADVESISLLKDASAAIYGVRAANGVILVTTKRGKSGKPVIQYDGNMAFQHLTRIAPRVNAWQYMTYYNELAVINGTQTPYDPDEIEKYKQGNDPDYTSTDWTNQVYKAWAPQTSHALSVSGGTDVVRYNVSGQYINQQSNYSNSDLSYQNFNLRSNIDIRANKYIKFNVDLAAWKETSKNPAIGDNNIMHEMISIYPFIPVYWKNGLPSGGLGYGRNPVLMSSTEPGYNNITYLTFNPKLGVDVQLPFITKGLSVGGYGAFDNINTFNKFYQRPWHAYSYNKATDTYTDQYSSTALSQITQTSSQSAENTLFLKLGYDRQFGDHNVSAFAAYEQTTYNYTSTTAHRQDLLGSSLDQLFSGADLNQIGTGSASQWGRASYFGKVDYAYKGKYLANLILRYNGSFNFAPDKQWGMFPAVALGWRISDENFFKPLLPVINNLKLRASWGIMGSDAVAQYYYMTKYGIVTNPAYLTYFSDSYTQSTNLSPSSVPNPDITWEKQDTRNLGVDMTLLQNKLNITFDVFRNYRSDILAQPISSVPLYTGLSLPFMNIGKSLNRGFEFAINYRHATNRAFQYSVGVNLTYAKSKVIYQDESPNIPVWQQYTGHTVDSWLTYKTNGIYHTQDEVLHSPHLPGAGPGDLWIQDIDHDGQITSKDMVRIDYGVKPRLSFGLPISFTYKGWSLNMIFAGQTIAKVQIRPQAQSAVVVPPTWVYDDRFVSTEATPDAKFPRASNNGDSRNNVDADLYVRDASFLRLKNAELSYSFIGNDFLRKASISQLRLFVGGSNIFSVDGLKKYGVDPENTSLTGVSYPQTRIIRFGLNVTL